MAPRHTAFPLSSKESFPVFCVDSNQHTKENMHVLISWESALREMGEMMTATELGQKVSSLICQDQILFKFKKIKKNKKNRNVMGLVWL